MKLIIVITFTTLYIKKQQVYVGLANGESNVKEITKKTIKKGDTVLVNYDGKEIQSKVTWVGKYQKIGNYQLFEFDNGFKWTRVSDIIRVVRRKK